MEWTDFLLAGANLGKIQVGVFKDGRSHVFHETLKSTVS